MDETAVAELLKESGYHLLPKAHPNSPGYSGLLVALRDYPTGKRFNPVALRVNLREDEAGVCQRMVKHASSAAGLQHLCPGLVTLFGHSDNVKDFFTFGASMEVSRFEEYTICSITSAAPILDLSTSRDSVAAQLAAETDAVLAQVVVRWEPDAQHFSEHLAEADPFQLYAATLESILNRYHHAPSLQETFRRLYEALQQEKHWLMRKGLWPQKTAILEKLLDSQA